MELLTFGRLSYLEFYHFHKSSMYNISVPKPTRSDKLANFFLLQFEIFLDWSKQLAEAANFLTVHRVVHRDMKLSNVLVAGDGRLKVCDFGAAIQTESADLKEPYHPRMSPGGNTEHLAPEVLRTVRTRQSNVNK